MKALVTIVLVLLAVAFGAAGASYYLVREPESVQARYLREFVERWTSAAAGPETPANPSAEPESGMAVADEGAAPEAESAASPDEPWRGLGEADWYCGPKLDAAAFRDRVALVCLWDAKIPESVAALARVEELAKSFRRKSLVVVGSHRGGRTAKAEAAVKSAGVTFAMYEGARYAKEPRNAARGGYPYYYVVDHYGKVAYAGVSDRAATEVLVGALTEVELARRKDAH